MKTIKFRLFGEYGHFKIPYSNNNPLTYAFITKPALVGLMGAVVGIERSDMKRLFPILCEDIKYSISLNKPFKKEAISNYSLNFNNIERSDRPPKTPRPMEYIKNPDWDVYVNWVGNSDEAGRIFHCFCENIKDGYCAWMPTLGIKQCKCTIEFLDECEIDKQEGNFTSRTFVLKPNLNDLNGLIYSELIPTHQDENWFNDPSKDVCVYFKDNQKDIFSHGEYFVFRNENIVLI